MLGRSLSSTDTKGGAMRIHHDNGTALHRITTDRRTPAGGAA